MSNEKKLIIIISKIKHKLSANFMSKKLLNLFFFQNLDCYLF